MLKKRALLAFVFLFPFFPYGQQTPVTVALRFAPPPGFERVSLPDSSFGAWLRRLPLKPEGSALYDFQGRLQKSAGDTTLAAIIDLSVKGRRLEQCMDILARLYSSYCRERGKSSGLVWPLPGGTPLSFKEWQQGKRPLFSGSRYRVLAGKTPASGNTLRGYLNTVYELSGTQTFYFACPRVSRAEIRPGDFIVKKGGSGHAVLILDVARNKNGETRVLIAQGDTPAVPLHILRGREGQVWFETGGENPSLPIKKKMYWSGLRRFGKNCGCGGR